MKKSIDPDQYSATRIVDAFAASLTFPMLFSKDAIELAIAHLETDLSLSEDNLREDGVYDMYLNYIDFLKKQIIV